MPPLPLHNQPGPGWDGLLTSCCAVTASAVTACLVGVLDAVSICCLDDPDTVEVAEQYEENDASHDQGADSSEHEIFVTSQPRVVMLFHGTFCSFIQGRRG